MFGQREGLLPLITLIPPQLKLGGPRHVGVEGGPKGGPHLVAEVAGVLAVARLLPEPTDHEVGGGGELLRHGERKSGKVTTAIVSLLHADIFAFDVSICNAHPTEIRVLGNQIDAMIVIASLTNLSSVQM